MEGVVLSCLGHQGRLHGEASIKLSLQVHLVRGRRGLFLARAMNPRGARNSEQFSVTGIGCKVGDSVDKQAGERGKDQSRRVSDVGLHPTGRRWLFVVIF